MRAAPGSASAVLRSDLFGGLRQPDPDPHPDDAGVGGFCGREHHSDGRRDGRSAHGHVLFPVQNGGRHYCADGFPQFSSGSGVHLSDRLPGFWLHLRLHVRLQRRADFCDLELPIRTGHSWAGEVGRSDEHGRNCPRNDSTTLRGGVMPNG